MSSDTKDLPADAAELAATSQDALGGPQLSINLPPGDDGASFKAWQSHLSFACSTELIDPTDAAAFHVASQMYMLRQFLVSSSTISHPHRMVRTGEDVARTGLDLVQLSVHLDGGFDGRCGSQPFHTRPGDVSFIDYAVPFDFEVTPYSIISLVVPRATMPEPLRQRTLHGLVPDAAHPATRLLARLIRETHAALPGLTLAQGVAAVGAVLELAVGVSQGDDGPHHEASTAELNLFSQAQALIERNIGDDTLSAASLVQALKTSRGALYGVFAEHGGIQAYIRERRLQRCYEAINGNYRANETIGAVAFSLGFRSEAHFSRAFRERFGLAPRDLRMVARQRGVDALPAKASGVAPDSLQTLRR